MRRKGHSTPCQQLLDTGQLPSLASWGNGCKPTPWPTKPPWCVAMTVYEGIAEI